MPVEKGKGEREKAGERQYEVWGIDLADHADMQLLLTCDDLKEAEAIIYVLRDIFWNLQARPIEEGERAKGKGEREEPSSLSPLPLSLSPLERECPCP